MAAWSLASPLFASPDEPAHVTRAVALDRLGELVGRTVTNASNPVTDITTPKDYSYAVTVRYLNCFAFRPTTPASCTRPLTASTTLVPTTTYVGRYPPLYYAIVGLPTRLVVSPTGLYLMRFMSALLNAAFLALAVMTVVTWSESRLLLVGLLLAATPMTFFLGSVVNPSGLEITSAICLWCSGLVLALERPQAPPPGLVAVVTASAATLLLARGLSPLWVVLIVALLALLAGWQGVLGITRAHAVRWSSLVLVPCAAFALVWVVVAHALDALPIGTPVGAGETNAHLLANIFGQTGGWIQQMIGDFGWLDTPAPLLTYLLWYGALGVVVLVALSCSRSRHVAGLLLLIAAVLVVPVILQYAEARRHGIGWQGRYTMPLAVGVPLVAMALAERSEMLRWPRLRLATVLCVVIGVADLAAFAENLRRYTVGVAGPIDFLRGSWHPPLGAPTLTAGALAVTVLTLGFVRYLIAIGAPRASDSHRERGPV